MIGIVGGGVAGLAAAYRLQERGHRVTVFEASDDLGGLAAAYETAGDPIEKYYHHLSKSEETIVELAEDLGLSDRIEWRYKSDAFYADGVVHPMDKPWEIAAYPYLSLYDKFRLGMLVLEIDVRGGIPDRDAYGDITDYEDVTAVEFVREHTTEGVFENFWKPLLAAKFGSRMDEVSAAWLLGRIKFRGERDLLRGEQLGYLEGGFQAFVEALLGAVGRDDVESGARVTDLAYEDGAVTELTAETAAGARTYDVDGVVVAAMPNVLESLTGYVSDVEFQGTVCSVWSLSESLTDTYWLNFLDRAPFGVFIEHTNFVPPERYGGEHLYYTASYVQDPAEDLWQMSDADLEAHWRDGIADLFPAFDTEMVNWVETARNPRTAPVYETGYLDTVIPYDLSSEVGDGVYYAGMASRAQYPERSLNGAVEAGFAAADAAADRS